MNIKVGDLVRRKDGTDFYGGSKELEIVKIREVEELGTRVDLSNGFWTHPDRLELVEKVNDTVNQPTHYTYGEIETIDYIRDKLTPEQFEGYCIGNVMKYISRYRHKNGVEDLEKAKVYLEWANEAMER